MEILTKESWLGQTLHPLQFPVLSLPHQGKPGESLVVRIHFLHPESDGKLSDIGVGVELG